MQDESYVKPFDAELFYCQQDGYLIETEKGKGQKEMKLQKEKRKNILQAARECPQSIANAD